MAHGGLEHLPERNDLVVQRAPRGCFAGVRPVALRVRIRLGARRHPVDSITVPAVILERPILPRNGIRWSRSPRLVAFDPARTAVAFGDDLVLALELRGGLLETFR